MAFSVVKACTKVGLSGGAIYWTVQQGVWGEPKEGADAMKRLLNTMVPDEGDSTTSTKTVIPKLQKMAVQHDEGILRSGWNKGAKVVFECARDAPQIAVRATSNAKTFVQETFKS